MKKLLFLLVTAIFLLGACSQKVTQDYYGEKFDPAGASAASEVVTMMTGKDSVQAKVAGKINAACQVKGCWMTMDLENGEDMQVRFKDYGFFVPKNSGGKTAVVEGWAYRKIIPVDELQHYAGDEGKSEEEIAAITEPEEKIVFIANGVYFEKEGTQE